MTYCFRCTSCSALHGLEILNIFGSFLFTSLCTYIRKTMWPWAKGKLLSKWWHSRPLDVRVGLYYIDQKVESEHNLIFQRGPRRNMKRTCPVVRLGLVCTSLDILVSIQMLTGVGVTLIMWAPEEWNTAPHKSTNHMKLVAIAYIPVKSFFFPFNEIFCVLTMCSCKQILADVLMIYRYIQQYLILLQGRRKIMRPFFSHKTINKLGQGIFDD